MKTRYRTECIHCYLNKFCGKIYLQIGLITHQRLLEEGPVQVPLDGENQEAEDRVRERPFFIHLLKLFES